MDQETDMHRYPVYVNIWKTNLMDTHRDTMVGIEKQEDKLAQVEAQDGPKGSEAPVEIQEKN